MINHFNQEVIESRALVSVYFCRSKNGGSGSNQWKGRLQEDSRSAGALGRHLHSPSLPRIPCAHLAVVNQIEHARVVMLMEKLIHLDRSVLPSNLIFNINNCYGEVVWHFRINFIFKIIQDSKQQLRQQSFHIGWLQESLSTETFLQVCFP